MRPEFAERIQLVAGEFIAREKIDAALKTFASRVRLNHSYKTSELERNPLTLIFTVLERLEVCSRLMKAGTESIFPYYEKQLAEYLYLTCFDRFGQPADWVDFGSWLKSKHLKHEREKILSIISHIKDTTEAALVLYSHYQRLYGVKSSFFRFLHGVLPKDTRRLLLDSIEIVKMKYPPSLEKLPQADDNEKEAYLFKRRNDYTHKADFAPPAGEWLGRSYSALVQEHRADYWITTRTLAWPGVLRRVVCIGLASYLCQTLAWIFTEVNSLKVFAYLWGL
ncbi:MAG: hypothetical protein ABIN18_03805 [Pseudomonadota bacterium]